MACSREYAPRCEAAPSALFEAAVRIPVATVAHRGANLSRSLLAALVAAALLTSACGSSSQIDTVAGPSPAKCGLQLTAEGAPFPAAGGSGSLRIDTARECRWSAKTDAPWVTIAQPAEGQGEGAVRFSVGANGEATPRTGAISVNDQRLEISQAGKPCELTVSSNHESVDGAGGDLSVNVRASAAQCAWTASSSVSWISIVAGREGRGSGAVTFHVEAVVGPPRTGNLTIAGQNVQVDQGTGCSYAIGVDTFSVESAGGDRQVPVTTSAGCPWTAESRVPWITVTSGATGSGPGVASFRVAPADTAARTGTLSVAGRTVTVTQSPGCTYAVGAETFSVDAAGGDRQVAVTAGPGCPWTAESRVPWITIASDASGSGAGAVVFRVAASDGPGRSGTLIVAGRTITVSQALGCTYSIAPGAVNVSAQAGTTTIQVDAGVGCAWTASSALPWATITGGASGSGPGQVQIATAANDGPARSGTIAIAGRSLSVAQASGCTFTIAPSSQDLAGDGGNVAASVTTATACPWTVSTAADWITVATPSGTGPGQASFTIKPNLSPPRSGTVSIAGRPFAVNQASQCSWLLLPPFHEFGDGGGNGNVLVIVSGACSWTAVSNASWIQITAGSSGVGNGLLQLVVPRNTGGQRTGTITVAGQSYLVRQQGVTSDVR